MPDSKALDKHLLNRWIQYSTYSKNVKQIINTSNHIKQKGARVTKCLMRTALHAWATSCLALPLSIPHCLPLLSANCFLSSRDTVKHLHPFLLLSRKTPLVLHVHSLPVGQTSLILGDKHKKLHFVTHSYQGKMEKKKKKPISILQWELKNLCHQPLNSSKDILFRMSTLISIYIFIFL